MHSRADERAVFGGCQQNDSENESLGKGYTPCGRDGHAHSRIRLLDQAVHERDLDQLDLAAGRLREIASGTRGEEK